MDNTFIGKPCPKGHTLRYVIGRKCAVCKRQDGARKKNVKKRSVYYRKNVESARASARKSNRKLNGVVNPTSESGHGERCAICNIELLGKGQAANAPSFDHDHSTGLFRDWLCSRHNRGIGSFNDDPQLLRKAADYIERCRQEHSCQAPGAGIPAELNNKSQIAERGCGDPRS